ncbi:hypothetical protein [Paraburkholderia tropica]|uniref:hypothetical protein n=1 Tax=Paraburkholderia tropica TaxID=92647 RepID=UPI002AB7EB4A|nr:hypothetical protein [Paraburkholderia tropica]
MSEPKFTKGPWEFDPQGDLPVLQIYCADKKNPFHHEHSDEEQVANARLMAASPELFEALQEVFAIGERLVSDVYGSEFVGKARAALAKALGE